MILRRWPHWDGEKADDSANSMVFRLPVREGSDCIVHLGHVRGYYQPLLQKCIRLFFRPHHLAFCSGRCFVFPMGESPIHPGAFVHHVRVHVVHVYTLHRCGSGDVRTAPLPPGRYSFRPPSSDQASAAPALCGTEKRNGQHGTGPPAAPAEPYQWRVATERACETAKAWCRLMVDVLGT